MVAHDRNEIITFLVVQRPATLYPPNVGIRVVLLSPFHLAKTPVDRGYFSRDYPDKQDRVQAEEGSGLRTSGKGL